MSFRKRTQADEATEWTDIKAENDVSEQSTFDTGFGKVLLHFVSMWKH